MNLSETKERKYLTLPGYLYQEIYNKIIHGEFKGGQRLLLSELASRFNTSITPVREAIKELENNGLVNSIPNKGAQVVSLNFRDFNEIYDLRRYFECLAIELICLSKDLKRIVGNLYKICDDDSYLIDKNIEKHTVNNFKFHQYMVNASCNKRLINFYNGISSQLKLLEIITDRLHSNPDISIVEHRKIVKALEKRNQDLTLNEIKRHITNVKENVLNGVKKELNKEDIDNISINVIIRSF